MFESRGSSGGRQEFPSPDPRLNALYPKVRCLLTTQNELSCHEERGGACGAVVVDIHDGDASQAQAVIYGSLSTCGVAWWNKCLNISKRA